MNLEIINFREVLDKLKKTNDSLKDMSPFFKEVAFREEGTTDLRFRDQEDPDGNRWRNPITIRRNAGGSQYSKEAAWAYWKKSNFHALPQGWHEFRAGQDKIMVDTGMLLNSIQGLSSKDEALIGTNVRYSKYVTALGFRFLGVSESTRDNIKEIYELYMKGKL